MISPQRNRARRRRARLSGQILLTTQKKIPFHADDKRARDRLQCSNAEVRSNRGVAMRLFSYKQTHDTGFAPNPFHGVCTLATCKARIRLKKQVGDWVAGFTSARLNGDPVGSERLIYLMQVSEKLGLDEYYRAPVFAAKIPRLHAARCVDRAGDNIYYLEAGQMKQVENPSHDLSNVEDDTSGEFVLVGRRFYYFGSQPLVVPRHLRPDVPPGVAKNGVETKDQARAQAFIDWVDGKGQGIHAPPHRWPEGDESWRQA
jgi:hypothetical protein